jgi:hypothetical protein
VLPSAFYDSVGIPSHVFTRLNSPARAYPYRRFATILADGNARLGAIVVRYSFDVERSHLLLQTGLSRRSIDKALNRGYVLLPLAAPHHRRNGLVCFRPCTGQVVQALFTAAVEARPRMTYETCQHRPRTRGSGRLRERNKLAGSLARCGQARSLASTPRRLLEGPVWANANAPHGPAIAVEGSLDAAVGRRLVSLYHRPGRSERQLLIPPRDAVVEDISR